MMKTILSVIIIGIMLCGCSAKKSTQEAVTGRLEPTIRVADVPKTGSKTQAYLPDATAFRMSGDYQNNVGVTFDASGNLIYYPDPSDITADSEPIEVGDGWWLNRQGLSQHSVFTKYTFAEYASLPQAPTPEQIKAAVIPGAKVTRFVELPWKINDATVNLSEIKEYLENR